MKDMLIETSWFWRRFAILATIISSLGLQWYLAIYGADTALNRDLAQATSLMLIAIVPAYAGFAVWDDKNKMAHGLITQAAPPVSSPPPRTPVRPAIVDDDQH